jgi:Rrf2 family protein
MASGGNEPLTRRVPGMLTSRTKYGLKAMLYLTEHYAEGGVRGIDIAESEGIPKKFLDLIMLELKEHGLITSRKGRQGGYRLARQPQDITMAQVVRILEGPLAPAPCASRTAYRPCPECPDVRTCRLRVIMSEVRDAISGVLDSETLADAVAREHDPVLDYSI